MKSLRGGVTSSQSCSCTSCFYKSESDRSSVKQLLIQGSRVDKLYLGKYIPLRERKLLGKLVRTRAAYDDIRTELLSDSNLSLSEKANLKPTKHMPLARRGKKLEDTEKNHSILELIDLVDRGAALGSRRISECCSCCSCGSNIHLSEREARVHRHPHPPAGSRSSMISGHRARDKRRIHRNIGKHVQLITKRIKSDPCTCTSKLSGMIKRESEALLKKLHGRKEPMFEPHVEEENRIITSRKVKGFKIKHGMGEIIRKSLTKIKQSKTKLKKEIISDTRNSLEQIKNTKQKVKAKIEESVRKETHKTGPTAQMKQYEYQEYEHQEYDSGGENILNAGEGKTSKFKQSKTRLKNEIKAGVRNSLEKIRDKKQKIKAKIDESVKKTIHKTQPTAQANEYESDGDGENIFNIKKDSLMKYRTDIERKKMMKEWECDFECNPDECVPEECFKIITRKRLRKGHRKRFAENAEFNQTRQTDYLNASDVVMQAKKEEIAIKTATKSKKIAPENINAKEKLDANTKKQTKIKDFSKVSKVQNTCKCDNGGSKSPLKTKSVKSNTSLPQKTSNSSVQSANKVSKPDKYSNTLNKKNNLPSSKTQLARSKERHAVKQSINSKERQVMKKDRTGSISLKRCFCTLKLKQRKKRFRTNKTQKKDSSQSDSKSLQKKRHSTNTNTTNRSNKSISTSSSTAKSVSTGDNRKLKAYKTEQIGDFKPSKQGPIRSKIIDIAKAPRQAVRISSNFSFSIEFIKDEGHDKNKIIGRDMSSERKASKDRTVNTRLAHKPSQTTSSGKSKYTLTNHSLRRCFCTLKLGSKGQSQSKGTVHRKSQAHFKDRQMVKNKFRNQLSSTGTETKTNKEDSRIHTKYNKVTKSTSMKNKLKSYECEPNFCVPGDCDPYQCLERIKVRDMPKSKEFGADTKMYGMKSTSSSTHKWKRKRDSVTQSQQKKVKNVAQKRRSTPLSNKSKVSVNKVPASSSRQAVRIGSSFSFNIEFSKSRSLLNNKSKGFISKHRAVKNNGENYHSRLAKQGSSQTLAMKKIDKESGIRPLLKRCFCTLKLQDKNTPTLMPVLIKNYSKKSQELLSKQSRKSHRLSNFSIMTSSSYSFCPQSGQSIFQKSLVNNLHRSKNSEIECYDSFLNSKAIITKLNFQRNLIIGTHQYLNSSFYAMNMRTQQLDPNECEPGICIPGQCDPIECKKLIMKRLLKKASTMTSNDIRNQSISSSTLHSKSKKQQYKKASPVQPRVKKQPGIKYKTLPRAHKQVVRVGSSFSFNIEFSKEKANTRDAIQERKINKTHGSSSTASTNTKKRRNRGTRDSQLLSQNIGSQSAVAMQHRGSHITPKFKRCFCTLKLQKKGRQNQAVDLKVDKLPDIVKTADVGQNTKKYRPLIVSNLDPNECEPNICIPGECDPYECLERIKRRGVRRNTKEFGTEMDSKKMATGSMTSSQKRATKRKQAHFKEIHLKTKPYKPIKQTVHQPAEPSRQAVRIGSNFSFNVEFFKDKSFPDDQIIDNEPSTHRKKHKYRTKKIDTSQRSNQKGIQDSKSLRHQDSQVYGPDKHETSTKMDSFMKRCFCTAKLQNKNRAHFDSIADNSVSKVANSNSRNPSFLKKCFCVIKSIGATKSKPKLNKSETSTFVQTKKVREKRTDNVQIKTLKLEPYECEPGVCTPGKCDPRVCAERIKRRNRNLNKMSSTEGPATTSTATLYQSTKTSSAASNAHLSKLVKNKPKTPSVKPHSHAAKQSPQRNVVRIGSNFSFNVEFYKEKNPTYINIESAAKSLKELKQPKVTATGTKIGTDAKAKSAGNSVLLHNRESQVDHVKKENRGSNVGPMLKRCFCTLALHKAAKKENSNKKKAIKADVISIGTKTPSKNYVKSKPYALEPYECEPGVCIPGKCDPYECEKRIKRRQRRDSGTETLSNTSKSSAMLTDSGRKRRDQNVQALKKPKNITYAKDAPLKTNLSPITHKNNRKQAVRIGSNFSFDIEFSKNGTSMAQHDTKTSRNRNGKSSGTGTRNSRSHKRTQGHKTFQHADSQVLTKRVMSTVTETAPFLKRCFCTLTIHNTETNKMALANSKPVIYTQENSTSTKQKKLKKYDLDPYECEPGVCVPDQCDPQECLERIKRRGIHRKSRTANTNRNSSSLATQFAGVTSRSKRIQSKDTKTQNGKTAKIVEQPRFPFTDPNYWQGLKIGSNISFNIEFYKENVLPKALKIHEKKLKNYDNANIQLNTMPTRTSMKPTNTRTRMRSCEIQARKLETENKASLAGKALKRCFCTAKFYQKKRENDFTVERVDSIIAMSPFKPTSYYVYQMNHLKSSFKTATTIANQKYPDRKTYNDHPCDPKVCTCLRGGLKAAAKSVIPCDIDPKYRDQKQESIKQPCNSKFCARLKNGIQTATLKKRGENLPTKSKINKINTKRKASHEQNAKKYEHDNMKTILPYTPRKFNKNESKTKVSNKTNAKEMKKYCCSYCLCKGTSCKDDINQANGNRELSKLTKSSKRLTAKEERTVLTNAPTKSKLKKFLCTCMRVFSKRRNEIDNNTHPEMNQHRNKKPIESHTDGLKKSKSDRCPHICRPQDQPKKSKSLKITKLSKNHKERIEPKISYSRLQSGDTENTHPTPTSKPVPNHTVVKKNICPACQSVIKEGKLAKVRPSVTSIMEKQIKGSKIKKQRGKQIFQKKKSSKFENNLQNNDQSIVQHKDRSKSAGDAKPIPNERNKQAECISILGECKGILTTYSKKMLSHKTQSRKSMHKDGIKPPSDHLQSKKHKETCRCCVCKKCLPQAKSGGAAVVIKAKDKKEKKQEKVITKQKNEQPKQQCVCGSPVCVKEANKMKKAQGDIKDGPNKKLVNPCVCGSTVCAKQSIKNKDASGRKPGLNNCLCGRPIKQPCICGVPICAQEFKKRNKLKEKIKSKKPCICGLSVCAREHRKINQKDNKQIGKSESRSIRSVLFSLCTPKPKPSHGFLSLKSCKNIKQKKKGCNQSCLSRVFPTRKNKTCMKTCRFPAFHVCPWICPYCLVPAKAKHRFRDYIRKNSPKENHGPGAENCNLYMASLRKKPWLLIYYLCPWFYPHCRTLLKLFSQMTKLVLYLLAVVVWSPFVCLIECCRFVICCFL